MTHISYRDSTMIVGCLTLRRGIPPRWSRVVAALLAHASSTTHHAWPCQMRLAAKAGCSVSTVKSCLRALRGWGLISVLPAATVAGLASGPHRAARRVLSPSHPSTFNADPLTARIGVEGGSGAR